MSVFNFPQFKHQPLWRYFSGFNDYHAYLTQNFEKWKICEVICVGLSLNLGVMLNPCVLAVFEACCLKLQMRFEISLNTWLRKLGSLSKLKKPLFTLLQILMLTIWNFIIKINLETLVFNKLMCLLFMRLLSIF